VSFADADADGLPDFYVTFIKNTSTAPDLFFLNTGGGGFAEAGVLRGIDDTNDGGSHGAAWADLDNDGDYDLLNGSTTPPGFGHDQTTLGVHNDIYRNDGSGSFTNVTPPAMLGREERTRAILALDWDNDGDLDIFAIQGSSPLAPSEVYRNDGNFQFTELTSGGLAGITPNQGATDTDYDGDGDVDVLAASRRGVMYLLKNSGNGTFTQVVPSSIGINHKAGDGISTADVDNDGDLDLLLTSDEAGHLYINLGNGTFAFRQSFSSTNGYMGSLGDLDNDGDLDLVFAGDEVAYLNDGAGNFSAGPAIPTAGINDPRAIAMSDIDNDGDLDFAIGAKNSRSWLTRNNFNSGNYLKVRLVSPEGQAGAFGSKVFIYPAGQAGGTILGMREAKSNLGYLGQDEPVLHFGLGGHTVVDLVVRFLDGTTVVQPNVSANQQVTVDASGPGDQTPPSAPASLFAAAIGENVELAWIAAGDPESGIASYKIYRGVTSGSGKALIAEIPGSQTTHIDDTTSPNTVYYYEVSAVNGSGIEGPRSNEATATTGEIQTQPVAHWKLDDGSGTTALDSAGGNHGTLINGPTWTAAGMFNGALDFDGVDDRVTVPTSPDLEVSGAITLAAWVNPDTLYRKTARILSKSDGTASNRSDYYLMATASTIEFAFFDGSLITTTSTVTLNPGQWVHIAGTYDGSTARLYLNGVEVASTAHSGSIRVSPKSLHLGSWGGSDAKRTWDGRLDDLRVYSQALSAAEIFSLYSGN